MLTPLSHLLPPLPGFAAPRTYAAWPVWSGSTTTPIRFVPMAKKAAVRLWHRARDFDRGTHQPGRHGGAVGHVGLAVLHASWTLRSTGSTARGISTEVVRQQPDGTWLFMIDEPRTPE